MFINKRNKLSVSILGLALILIVVNINCDWPFFFRRNPNLRLLLSKEGYSAFNPVWTPDGNKIYYLMVQQEGFIENYGGQLRVININGSEDRLVLDGIFGALAISPDGSKLALTCGSIRDGGCIILVDTSGAISDTLSSSSQNISDLEFNCNGNIIYYFANNDGFLKINIESNIEETILLVNSVGGFDIWDDSLIIFSGGKGKLYNLINESIREYDYTIVSIYPQFLPINPDTIVSIFTEGFLIADLKTKNATQIATEPYWISDIWYPYWSPDGKKIVFSASKMRGDPNRPSNHELWILEKIE